MQYLKYHLSAVMHCSATILDSRNNNVLLLVTDFNSTRNIERVQPDVTVVPTGGTLSGRHLNNCM